MTIETNDLRLLAQAALEDRTPDRHHAEAFRRTVTPAMLLGLLDAIEAGGLLRPPKEEPSARVDFGRFPMYARWDGGAASVHIQTYCVHTGEPLEVSASMSHGSPSTIRALAIGLLVHELDEALRADGKRVRDPHEVTSDACYECGREL